MCSFAETTHTPQGDGNTIGTAGSGAVKETTHTPQGDGNTPLPAVRRTNRRNNPHPARGRKPSKRDRRPEQAETTHTPQGDGNSKIAYFASAVT